MIIIVTYHMYNNYCDKTKCLIYLDIDYILNKIIINQIQ